MRQGRGHGESETPRRREDGAGILPVLRRLDKKSAESLEALAGSTTSVRHQATS
jgi:hypothetical protein